MSAFTLKFIAFILMVLDHVYYYIADTPIWFTYIGRIVAPIYFFLLVESFFHTRDRKKFMMRLFGFAFITFLILNLMFRQPLNIFASMAMGILMLNIIEFIKSNKENIFKKLIGCIGVIIVGILSLYTEASYYGVGMILIFYFLRQKKFLMSIVYIIFSLCEISFVFGTKYFLEELLFGNYQWMMVFSIIPILLYNGKPGYRSKFFKYFFYIAYPVHVIILLIIGNTLNPTWYEF